MKPPARLPFPAAGVCVLLLAACSGNAPIATDPSEKDAPSAAPASDAADTVAPDVVASDDTVTRDVPGADDAAPDAAAPDTAPADAAAADTAPADAAAADTAPADAASPDAPAADAASPDAPAADVPPDLTVDAGAPDTAADATDAKGDDAQGCELGATATGGGCAAEGFGDRLLGRQGFCLPGQDCELADVNGDGRADLIAFVKSTVVNDANDVWVSLSLGRTFGVPQKASDYFCVDGETCAVGDVNGDGRADLVAFARGAFPYAWVGLSRGDGTFAGSQRWSDYFCLDGEDCRVGDIDGDERADLLVFTHHTSVFAGIATDGAFAPSVKVDDYFCVGDEVCALGDVDGDGRADLVAFGSKKIWIAIAPAQGLGYSQPMPWLDTFCPGGACTLGDVDGDGRADFIAFAKSAASATVTVGLSTGTGILAPRVWHASFCLPDELCRVADVDGDGRADLVAFSRDQAGKVFVSFSGH